MLAYIQPACYIPFLVSLETSYPIGKMEQEFCSALSNSPVQGGIFYRKQIQILRVVIEPACTNQTSPIKDTFKFNVH